MAAQPSEDLVTRDEFYLATVDLTDAALNLHAPGLFDIRVSRPVEGLNQRQSELRALGIGQLSRLFP